MRVTVTEVTRFRWNPPGVELDIDILHYDCGHGSSLDHEDDNASLVGAETECEEQHTWRT